MTSNRGRILWAVVCLLLVVVFAAGCTSTQVEYDRMTGTAFPQSTTVNGANVTLTTIYLQGGKLLSVVEDDTGIVPLTGPINPADPNQYDYITFAELDGLVTANRNSPIGKETWGCSVWIFRFTCTRYNIHGIVVNHYREYDNGTRSTGLMGWMYDPVWRSGFVTFYKNAIVSGDNNKYLRSTAHEIGHAFNLSHCDGDGSTTIMNQTGVVGDTYTYEFSSSSLVHLQDHPDEAVWPGIGPRHYSCPHVH